MVVRVLNQNLCILFLAFGLAAMASVEPTEAGCPEKSQAESLARALLKHQYEGSEHKDAGQCTHGYLQPYDFPYQCLTNVEIHAGIDIRGDLGDTIHSPIGGVLQEAACGPREDDYHTIAIYNEDKNITFVLLHSGSCTVTKIGSPITPGQAIGTVGSKGSGDFVHMHVEIRPGKEEDACCNDANHMEGCRETDLGCCSSEPGKCDPPVCAKSVRQETENPLEYLPDLTSPPPTISFVRDRNKNLDVYEIDQHGLVVEGMNFGETTGEVLAETTPAKDRPEITRCLKDGVYTWKPEISSWSDSRIKFKPFPQEVESCDSDAGISLTLEASGLEFPIFFTVIRDEDSEESQAFPFPFMDIASSPSIDGKDQEWYSEWITRTWSLGTGIIRGYGEDGAPENAGNFYNPTRSVNQAEALKMVAEIVINSDNLPTTCTAMATEDPDNNQLWLQPYWCYALTESWLEIGDLKPNEPTERGQIARWLVKAKGFTLAEPPEQEFTDIPLESGLEELAQVAHQLKINGIIDGKQSLCTRAPVADIDPCDDYSPCIESCNNFADCPCFCQCDYLNRAEAAKIVWLAVAGDELQD